MHHRDGRAPHSSNSRRARPDISVMVVNYNTAHLLGELFAALEASRGALKLPADCGRQRFARRLRAYSAREISQ